jgi:glycosyltransferase involved in cell wall biosynthesis
LGHGGSERQLAATALNLDRGRFVPHVASVTEGFHAAELRRAGVPILHLPLRSFYHPGTLLVARKLRSYIRTQGIRLVHTFDYSLSLFGVPVARSCPGVVTLSSQRFYMDLVPAKYRRPLLLTHKLAHGVVANCEEMRRHLSQDYRYPGGRIQVCYNGLDTEVFCASGRKRLTGTEDASLVIGTSCVLRPEKNLAQLLEAFASVRNVRSGMRLLIAGSGPERDRLVALSVTLGIAAECVFLPSTANVAEALRGIDIFVHPSLSEGLPNAVMEAMACGCATIASRVGGCPEVVENETSGLLVKPGDRESLTSRLRLLVEDDALRMRLATAAAARMQEFSIAKAAERMGQIYEAAL